MWWAWSSSAASPVAVAAGVREATRGEPAPAGRPAATAGACRARSRAPSTGTSSTVVEASSNGSAAASRRDAEQDADHHARGSSRSRRGRSSARSLADLGRHTGSRVSGGERRSCPALVSADVAPNCSSCGCRGRTPRAGAGSAPSVRLRPRNSVPTGSSSTTRNRKKLKTRTKTSVPSAPSTLRPTNRAVTLPAWSSTRARATPGPLRSRGGRGRTPHHRSPAGRHGQDHDQPPCCCCRHRPTVAVDSGPAEVDVRRRRVGEQHRSDLGGLLQPAFEPVGAVGLEVGGLEQDEVGRLVVEQRAASRATISTRRSRSSSTFCCS